METALDILWLEQAVGPHDLQKSLPTKISPWFYAGLLFRRNCHFPWTHMCSTLCSHMLIVSTSKLALQFCGTWGLLHPQRLSSPKLLLDSSIYKYALHMGLSTLQRFLGTPKLGVGGGRRWNEDRMTMSVAEIPHSNSCHLHYCQVKSELLPIIHCLAWGKWNGGFPSLAEMRIVQPSEEPCRVAKEMSNIIWSKSIFKVLWGTVLALYTSSSLHI